MEISTKLSDVHFGSFSLLKSNTSSVYVTRKKKSQYYNVFCWMCRYMAIKHIKKDFFCSLSATSIVFAESLI